MSTLGQKQTYAAHKLMSAKCQEQTSRRAVGEQRQASRIIDAIKAAVLA
jgi:hypothetical protein